MGDPMATDQNLGAAQEAETILQDVGDEPREPPAGKPRNLPPKRRATPQSVGRATQPRPAGIASAASRRRVQHKMKSPGHISRLHYGKQCDEFTKAKKTCKITVRPSLIPEWVNAQSDWRRMKDSQIEGLSMTIMRALMYLNRANKYYAAGATLVTMYSPRALHRHLCPLATRRFHLAESALRSMPVIGSTTEPVVTLDNLAKNILFDYVYGMLDFASDTHVFIPMESMTQPTVVLLKKINEIQLKAQQPLLKVIHISAVGMPAMNLPLDQHRLIQNVVVVKHVFVPEDRNKVMQLREAPNESPQLINTPFYTLQADNNMAPNLKYVTPTKNIRRKLKAGWQLLYKSMIMLENLQRAFYTQPRTDEEKTNSERILNSLMPYQQAFLRRVSLDITWYYRTPNEPIPADASRITPTYRSFFDLDVDVTSNDNMPLYRYLHMLMEYLTQYNLHMSTVTKSMKRAAAYAGIQ